MMSRRHSISEEDYKMLMNAKKQIELAKNVNMKFEREFKRKEMLANIHGNERDIKFKREQISSGKFLESHAEFADGLKPKHILETEIEFLIVNVEKLKRQVEQVDALMEDDADG